MRKSALIGTGIIVVLCCMLGVYLWTDGRQPAPSQLRIGYAVEAPYAFVLANGTITGESPEVAKVIASRIGVHKIIWRQVDFSALIPELEEGRIDVIAAGMFITPERARRIDFSEPSFHVFPALLVEKGNPHALHSYQDVVANPALRCAVLAGSIEEMAFRALGMPTARLVLVPDVLTGRVALETRLAQCLALSAPTLEWMILQDRLGKTEVVRDVSAATGSAVGSGYGGFGFRKDDQKLLQAWNRELKMYVGSEEHIRLIATFGFTKQELPGNITTEEVLSR